MNNWKKEFEHKFGAYALLGSAGRFYNGAFANEARIREATIFIQSLLDKQADEAAEMQDEAYHKGYGDALTILKGEE
jgi:hypothetical protein